MIGKLDPEESVMYPGPMLGKLAIALEIMGWDPTDDVDVEIAGTSIYEIEGAGTKWAPKKGTRKYNKDAFIVIKNKDRNPTISSQPNPKLKAHHLKTEKEINAELKKRDDELNYDTYSK